MTLPKSMPISYASIEGGEIKDWPSGVGLQVESLKTGNGAIYISGIGGVFMILFADDSQWDALIGWRNL